MEYEFLDTSVSYWCQIEKSPEAEGLEGGYVSLFQTLCFFHELSVGLYCGDSEGKKTRGLRAIHCNYVTDAPTLTFPHSKFLQIWQLNKQM